MHMPQNKTFCNYDGSFYSQSQKFSREQDLVALGSLARRSAISEPLCLQYYRILLGEGQSPLYSSLKRHNKEYPIAFCYMSYSYIVVQVFFLKKPDCPSLQNCNLVQIYQRAKNAIKYQVPKQKNRIENFSHTQYDTRVLIPTSQLLFQLNRGGLKSNKVQYQDALLFSSCF